MDAVILGTGGASGEGDATFTAVELGESISAPNLANKDKQIAELEYGMKILVKEKDHLLSLLSESEEKTTMKTVGTGMDARENVANPPPGSIMSLSTGSEESAVEEEKFVKIKPCEMESSSSKASSQSGKENLELEEQILHLNDQLERLKDELNAKEEECRAIKLELETTLLEKNVESESISKYYSEVKSLKQDLIAKDEETDEVMMILDEVLDQIKLSPLLTVDSSCDSLESKLNAVKGLPSILKKLQKDIQGKTSDLEEVKSELSDLQEQQGEVIAGYQLVAENYQKLQLEFEEFKQRVSSEQNEEVSDELERFKEELLSKDEDLIELQSKCDALEQSLKEKEHELKELRNKFDEHSVAVVLQVHQSAGTEPSEATPVFLSSSSPVRSPIGTEHIQIRKLKDQCLEQLQGCAGELQRRESTLRKERDDLRQENSELRTMISLHKSELLDKRSEVEQLLLSLREYEDSIIRKTTEINETIVTKDIEIENLMSTYNSYYKSKERLVAELNAAINQKNELILSLENKAQKQEEETHKMKLEFNDALDEIKESHKSELAELVVQLDSCQLMRMQVEAGLKSQLQQSQATIQSLMMEKSLAASRVGERVNEETSRFEKLQSELDRLRKEHLRVTNLLETTKQEAREEYDKKLKEDEILRESETVPLHQEVILLREEQVKTGARIKELMNLLAEAKTQNERLRTEISGLKLEKVTLQSMVDGKVDELTRNNNHVLKLESELKDWKEKLLSAESAVRETEAHTLVASALKREGQAVAASDVRVNDQVNCRIQQLEEELRILNESFIAKERKIELLQSKISEIESSEIKAFEESFKLKDWVRHLELDNLKYQDELRVLTNTNDANENPKIRALQGETMRLVYALDERDKRCVQLTLEITRLLEERDGLQLKLSNVLKHNVELTSDRTREGQTQEAPIYDEADLQTKLAQLEDSNFRINIDLKREREARKLVQEQLLFSQTSRVYRDRDVNSRHLLIEKSPTNIKSAKSSLPNSGSLPDSGHVSPASLEQSGIRTSSGDNLVHI